MASQSRADRLIKTLGGEENLPPKLPVSAPADVTTTDTKQDLQPINDFLDQNGYQEPASNGEDWWNAPPRIVRPAASSLPKPQHRVAIEDRGISGNSDSDTLMKPAPLGMSFCPLLAITKFPYKFVKREFSQAIATAFFDENKIWEREWEVYSVYSTLFDTGKPTLFVPESQVQALLSEINTTFPPADVKITDYNRQEGLVIDFDDIPHPELRPHFLGNSTSRPQIENWADTCRPVSPKMAVSERTLEAFKAKIEAAAEISKNKSKAKKKLLHEENLVKRNGLNQMLTRTQWYLGLPTKKEESKQEEPKQEDPKQEDPKQEESPIPDLTNLTLIPGFDITKPAPNPFEKDVIFISIDVEAFEEPPNPITEVGIATLDTRSLHNAPPGPNGSNWQNCITARHFRIEEYKNRINHKYVAGCPDKFEFKGGVSTFVEMRNIASTVGACFKPPYGADFPTMAEGGKLEKRNLILVGHDINADINYLRRLGVSLANFTSIIDTVDTASLFRVYAQQDQSRSLGHVFAAFDLMGWHLHNAGNDAVYTLWAMLAICVKHAAEKDDVQAKERKVREQEERGEMAAEEARERVREEGVGWEGDGGDGGVAVRPAGPAAQEGKGRMLFTAGGRVLDV